MTEEELAAAFTEGRLGRRAFVRQLVDRGMPMPAALSYADSLSPRTAAPAVRSTEATSPRERTPLSPRPTQAEGLEFNFVGDGYIVYHPTRERMHSLNHTAALVLELCTGENDADEIARLLAEGFGLAEVPSAATRNCLNSLHSEGLIR